MTMSLTESILCGTKYISQFESIKNFIKKHTMYLFKETTRFLVTFDKKQFYSLGKKLMQNFKVGKQVCFYTLRPVLQ